MGDGRADRSTGRAGPGGKGAAVVTTTTTLIHRVYNGPLEWWRDGLVYEIGSLDIGAADLEAAHGVLDHVASLGFNVVLVRPSRVPTTGDLSSFRSFAGRAHELGLRVITRISGALGPVTGAHAHDAGPIFTGQERGREGLMERAAAFLAEGADGVDLGTIVPPHISAETDLGLLSERFAILQALVAEHVDDGLIGADVSADYPDMLRHHLQDDWLHHLRDDALMLTRWNAESLTRHITHSLDEHDRFGAPPAWRYLPSYRLNRPRRRAPLVRDRRRGTRTPLAGAAGARSRPAGIGLSAPGRRDQPSGQGQADQYPGARRADR